MRADPAEDAEHRLHEQRAVSESASLEVRQVVEVRGVVALELEPGPVAPAELEDGLDVGIGVLEDQVAALLQPLPLPLVLELLEPVEHGKEPEVHRSHVQGSYLGL